MRFARIYFAAVLFALGTPLKAEGSEAEQSISVPAFTLPPSPYLSDEARKTLRNGIGPEGGSVEEQIRKGEIPPLRRAIARDMLNSAMEMAKISGVTIEEAMLGPVHGYWVRHGKMSADTGSNESRAVLLNLPSGGFLVGSAAGMGLVESIPLAAASGLDIFTMDYRQAPEAVFPAASEDVANAYRALLKDFEPGKIGIFGCSAGGLLTAQSLAWFQSHNLPAPGAAAILCASADAQWAGDSWSWQKPLRELTTPPSLDERFYYGGHDSQDPMLSPILSDAVLGRFPPTVMVTATRAPELSSAVNTHRLLVRNGVDASLNIWDGLGHAFLLDPKLPESKEAWTVIAKFMRSHLILED